ncbi:hypothetical protein AHF37_02582 [Paragonimus kellicotti]|nr:hypothetical protein AHF37_02582 [Paragonimus kellicotti]
MLTECDKVEDQACAEQDEKAQESPEGLLSAAQPNKRCVRFGDGDKLITAVFESRGPWASVEPLNPYELVGAYKIRCEFEKLEPLYSVLAQLQDINLRESYARRPFFKLKGTQLNESHVEVLEEIFKHVQFEHLNLENSNLSDESVIALCEMMEFYESCTELCLARNVRIRERGWKAVARLVRKMPCLKWLDLRCVYLNDTDVQSLAHAVRSQAMSCRAEMNKFWKSQMANQRLRLKDCTHSNSAMDVTSNQETTNETQALCPASESAPYVPQLPYEGLRGIHLGGIGLRDVALSRLINCVRLSSICDLRLNNNRLGPTDAVFLIPLLRYGASLRYLDLGRNRLGDDGCKVIANALASTAFAVPSANQKAPTGLHRLDLSENQLTDASMVLLGRAIPCCARLTCLQLSGNPKLGCSGLHNLQAGLIRCRRLKRLGLADCGIQSVGAVALAEVLVDKPRRLSFINLSNNWIDAAGLLALARCLSCIDRRVVLSGLRRNPARMKSSAVNGNDRLLNSVAKLATTSPPHSPQPVPPSQITPTDPLYQSSLDDLLKLLDRINTKFPRKPRVTSSRYCQITCPGTSEISSACSQSGLHNKDTQEELDPRYFWGDSSSSDDENDVIQPTNKPEVSFEGKPSSAAETYPVMGICSNNDSELCLSTSGNTTSPNISTDESQVADGIDSPKTTTVSDSARHFDYSWHAASHIEPFTDCEPHLDSLIAIPLH